MYGDSSPPDGPAPGYGPAPGEDRSGSSAVRGPGAGAPPFRYPVGIELIEGENHRQREAYDVVYLKDDEPPRYRYTIAVSADRLGDVFRALASLLPQMSCAVLEVPGPRDVECGQDCEGGRDPEDGQDGEDAGDGRDVCDVWTGPPVGTRAALREFAEHERVLVHDGMVGFGLVAAHGDGGPHGLGGAVGEVFVDEHKLVYLYSSEMESVDAALARLGLRPVPLVRHFSELGHVHVSLASRGEGEPYWEAAEELRTRLGLEWDESREYC